MLDDPPDCARCAREPFASLGVRRLESPRTVKRRVKLDCEPRAIVLHQGEFLLRVGPSLIVAHPALGGALKKADSGGQPCHRTLQNVQRSFVSAHCDILFTRCFNESQCERIARRRLTG
jgi:hypothetical protein